MRFFLLLFLTSCTDLQNRSTSNLENTFQDRKPAAAQAEPTFSVIVRDAPKGENISHVNTSRVHPEMEKYRHLMSPQHFECVTSFAKVSLDYKEKFREIGMIYRVPRIVLVFDKKERPHKITLSEVFGYSPSGSGHRPAPPLPTNCTERDVLANMEETYQRYKRAYEARQEKDASLSRLREELDSAIQEANQ